MTTAILAIHCMVCVGIVITVLLQKGKGADIGAVFGGSSQTVFGASGAGNALTKATWLLAAIFFSTSIFLAYASARRVTGSIFDRPFSSGPVSVMPATKPIPMPKNVVPVAPAPANQNPAGSATPGSTKK